MKILAAVLFVTLALVQLTAGGADEDWWKLKGLLSNSSHLTTHVKKIDEFTSKVKSLALQYVSLGSSPKKDTDILLTAGEILMALIEVSNKLARIIGEISYKISKELERLSNIENPLPLLL